MKAKLEVIQMRSAAGKKEGMLETLRGLGLRGVGTKVVVKNTPSFRGAVKKVLHLVQVAEVD